MEPNGLHRQEGRGDLGASAGRYAVAFEPQADIIGYVERRLGLRYAVGAMGVAIILDRVPVAGVVYNHFDGINVHMSIASEDARWCTPRTLETLFRIPFEHLRCRRVTATTLRANKDVRAFLRRLGFRQEGSLRQAGPNGETAVLYGITRSDCPWIMPPAQRRKWHDEQRQPGLSEPH